VSAMVGVLCMGMAGVVGFWIGRAWAEMDRER
jgi:hypothetical protein